MGLFGSIFHAIGSVAKAGLSTVTHGLSDKVFSVLKGQGKSKQVLNTPVVTGQQQALVNKLAPLGPPRVISTERTVTEALQPLRARYADSEGPYRTKKMPGRAKKRVLQRVATETGYVTQLAPAKRARMPRKARSGAPRKVPKGGLDLARIGQLWRSKGGSAATVGMSWQQFIKANSNLRVT